MQERISFFIYCQKSGKFLLFFDAKSNAERGKPFSIVFEKSMDLVDVLRDNLSIDAEDVLSLNWGAIYNKSGEEIKEMNYIAFAKSEKFSLNSSQMRCEWLEIDDFISHLSWEDSKKLLRNVLVKAIKREMFFNKKERGE